MTFEKVVGKRAGMRIFLAGASGVIGRRLTPLLVEAGHEVAGTTRSAAKAELVRGLGAEPVVVDVYDAAALREAVVAFAPDLVMHQLTDLPDDADQIPAAARQRADPRRGHANLIDAARAAGAERFLAQSIAWTPPPAPSLARATSPRSSPTTAPASSSATASSTAPAPTTSPTRPIRPASRSTTCRLPHASSSLEAPSGIIVIAE